MSKATNAPEKLKPYVSLGVSFAIPDNLTGVGSVNGDCPWCNKEGRFNVTLDEGVWRCNACVIGSPKGGGNVFTFLRVLHELSMKATIDHDYNLLAKEMSLLFSDTPKAWGLCKSVITGQWIVPGYNVQNGTREGGKIVTMYRYGVFDNTGKKRFGLTAGLNHGIHGTDIPTPVGGLQNTRRKLTGPVYRCEGLKDAMAFYEVACRAKINDSGGLSPTSNYEASLLWTGSVIAVPGADIYNPTWVGFSGGRPDYSLYHNDHPKENPPGTGRMVQAGLTGTKKAFTILSNAATPPKELRYLRWGADTFHNTDFKSGYDVRDHLIGPDKDNKLGQRIAALAELLDCLQPPPQEWLPGRTAEAVAAGKTDIEEAVCRDWKTWMNGLRKVGKPTEGIIRVALAGFSSILSVPSSGDQLWIMVVGPPSSFKSTMCELWSANRQYVLPKDTLTGVFSGWQMGLEKDENLSLAGEMNNKTLVIKDADTVLQSPQCPQILSQLRALYDRAVRVQYKNKMSKNWEGLNATVILCGTATLYQLDAAEKGARFLTVDIQPQHDYDLEDEITMRKAHEAFRNMGVTAGSGAAADTVEMADLKRLTAGYISYLRENATALIEQIKDPSGSSLEMCGKLAQFVSYMRSRPPKKQTEKVEREMPYRLTSQLVRLALGMAVVLNKRTMDDEVMGHVRAIALNTAHGKVMTLCDHLYAEGDVGSTAGTVSMHIASTSDEATELLRFLKRIKAVEIVPRPASFVVRGGKLFWRLTPRVKALYQRIFGKGGPSSV